MRYLTVEEVLALHDYQIERFGGSHGITNLPLLESALSRPETNISRKDMYGSVFEKAAVLAYSIIKNHPFVDGNKRTGLHSSLTFLELNGYQTNFEYKNLVKLGINIANNKSGLEKVAREFAKNAVLK